MTDIQLPGAGKMLAGVSEQGGELVFIAATEEPDFFDIVVFRNPESEQPVVEILEEPVPADDIQQALGELHVEVESWTEDDKDDDLFDFDFDEE